jgi:hypothetical protein
MDLKSSKAYIKNSLPGIHSGGPFNDYQSQEIATLRPVHHAVQGFARNDSFVGVSSFTTFIIDLLIDRMGCSKT